MHNIALFGESEKGYFHKAYCCRSLEELSGCLGEPPSSECQGLAFAVQALMYGRQVLFFRVKEEGFSREDYLKGLQLLKEQTYLSKIAAIGLPGVGSSEIIEATTPICSSHKSLLIMSERDLYDYLTYRG